jgi:hypothetical protein
MASARYGIKMKTWTHKDCVTLSRAWDAGMHDFNQLAELTYERPHDRDGIEYQLRALGIVQTQRTIKARSIASLQTQVTYVENLCADLDRRIVFLEHDGLHSATVHSASEFQNLADAVTRLTEAAGRNGWWK